MVLTILDIYNILKRKQRELLDSCHELMFTSEVNLELQMQTVHLMHF